MQGRHKKEFRKLSTSYYQLDKIDIKESEESMQKYYLEQEALNKRTMTFIHEVDFTQLTKTDLLRLMQIVSKYRPIDPWRFLVRSAVLFDNNELNTTTND